MNRIDLNGTWRLEGRMEKQPSAPSATFEDAAFSIDASVPGNIEIALENAGIVPEIFYADNAKKLRPYEFYEWVYSTDFEYSGDFRQPKLVFEGLDCFGTAFLNGNCLGSTSNAFISHSFDAAKYLLKGKNTLAVHIASANNKLLDCPMRPFVNSFDFNYEITWTRKPAHGYGWDIAPRICIGGLWRGVYLEEVPESRIDEFFIDTLDVKPNKATLRYSGKIMTPAIAKYGKIMLKIEGKCGDSSFTKEFSVWSYLCGSIFEVDCPKLWNVRNYGKPNLYDVKVSVSTPAGELLCEKNIVFGIRKIELRRTEVCTDSETPDFQFIVNNIPIRLCGTNHVPVDALHSRDAQGYSALLDMAADLNCNVIRAWGGGVYEDHPFYDRCDKEGILVWQDFMMGCANYPNDATFQTQLEAEADSVTRKLRQHPCIALWSGDNECDSCACWQKGNWDPNLNQLTRKVLPEVCRRNDPNRPYLPSSPYISPEAYKIAANKGDIGSVLLITPEQHLWGPRDYFKSDFYSKSSTSFTSEIGYHGCPSADSIRRFTPPEDCMEADIDGKNPIWLYHASAPYLPDAKHFAYRIKLMSDQVKEYFGECPRDLERFVHASQIIQAEAVKYFIELHRQKKKRSGIIWWNLKDCWPQTSDAVVDYYGVKKLAYYYIKVCQQPLLGMFSEADAWHRKIIFTNDSAEDLSGTFKLIEAISNEIVLNGQFDAPARKIIDVATLRAFSAERKLYILRWKCSNGTEGSNHCMTGLPCFSLDFVKDTILPVLAKEYGFDL